MSQCSHLSVAVDTMYTSVWFLRSSFEREGGGEREREGERDRGRGGERGRGREREM